jgi:L-2-hydroxyglutarate oxidase LhgO
LNLEHDSKVNGVDTVYKVEVKRINKIKGGYELLAMDADANEILFTTEIVVNSAGLGANDISTMAGIDDPDYTLLFWKGEYFSVGNGKEKFISRLIYPVPEQDNFGLGIHTTTDISGRLKLGPNAFYLEDGKQDYRVDGRKKKEFYNAVKYFLPFIDMDDLNPDYSGIRPKLQPVGKGERDFIIVNEAERGYKNFINLIGIESPGLTASMAIAEYVSSVIV